MSRPSMRTFVVRIRKTLRHDLFDILFNPRTKLQQFPDLAILWYRPSPCFWDLSQLERVGSTMSFASTRLPSSWSWIHPLRSGGCHQCPCCLGVNAFIIGYESTRLFAAGVLCIYGNAERRRRYVKTLRLQETNASDVAGEICQLLHSYTKIATRYDNPVSRFDVSPADDMGDGQVDMPAQCSTQGRRKGNINTSWSSNLVYKLASYFCNCLIHGTNVVTFLCLPPV